MLSGSCFLASCLLVATTVGAGRNATKAAQICLGEEFFSWPLPYALQ